MANLNIIDSNSDGSDYHYSNWISLSILEIFTSTNHVPILWWPIALTYNKNSFVRRQRKNDTFEELSKSQYWGFAQNKRIIMLPVDELNDISREFYERGKMKLSLSLFIGALGMMFLGFSATSGGGAAAASDLISFLADDEVPKTEKGAFGFTCFTTLIAFFFCIIVAIYISPVIQNSNEKKVLVRPQNVEVYERFSIDTPTNSTPTQSQFQSQSPSAPPESQSVVYQNSPYRAQGVPIPPPPPGPPPSRNL